MGMLQNGYTVLMVLTFMLVIILHFDQAVMMVMLMLLNGYVNYMSVMC